MERSERGSHPGHDISNSPPFQRFEECFPLRPFDSQHAGLRVPANNPANAKHGVRPLRPPAERDVPIQQRGARLGIGHTNGDTLRELFSRITGSDRRPQAHYAFLFRHVSYEDALK